MWKSDEFEKWGVLRLQNFSWVSLFLILFEDMIKSTPSGVFHPLLVSQDAGLVFKKDNWNESIIIQMHFTNYRNQQITFLNDYIRT